jgi:two-component system CheB/CheR fusion protein
VGIGASAGGLEALNEFFSNLGSDTGLAYAVVQHLAPSHESMLSEILSRATSMKVRQAGQGQRVEPDHVYVIPPARDMTIAEGVLRLAPRPPGGRQFFPIDQFFRSLAEECRTRAIGVVFSGTASDGMQGLKAIKSAGGITFAQDERSAKFPEMPRSAVASGAVDFVLPPAGIAQEIARLRNHPHVRATATEAEPVQATEGPHLDRILYTLRTVKGSDFTHYKQSTVQRRIRRRMALARIDRLEDYANYLAATPAEVEALYDDVLINVTSFFRDPAAFKALQKKVFATITRRRDAHARTRIWVPGCSTGEEVYSLAIALSEFMSERTGEHQVQIFGTDVSETIVERARVGRYPSGISADVSPERLRRFFLKTADGYQVNKTIRDLCVFAKHNLLNDPPFGRIDLVSCRNVLIYFTPLLQKRALSLFHYALRPGGYLVLGSSEHIGALTDLFTLVDKRNKIYSRRDVHSRIYFGTSAGEGMLPPPNEGANLKVTEARGIDIQHEADRIVMSRYVPAGVVVDSEMDILQFRGHTGPYLEPKSGGASLNLLRMAREGLVSELRSAFQRARREGVAVRRDRVRVKMDDHISEVSIEVVPFTSRQSRGRLYLVLFDATEGAPARGARAKKGVKKGTRAGGRNTEQELAATKDYLQTIIEEQEATNEELMSANEEILSSNEELQSTNEELETAKEELQSSNEELTTVNDELQSRNAELNDLNNDLKNLLATIHVPMVILDADLRVRRASPPGERLLNLIPADVGRRLTDLRPNVEIPHLDAIVHEVIDRVTVKDLEVRDTQGRLHHMHVRPFKTRDHKIDGVVITWTEIDPSRRPAPRSPRGTSQALLSAIERPAALLDVDLEVSASNAAWRHEFPGDDAKGPTAWGDPSFSLALRELSSGGTSLLERVVEIPPEGDGLRRVKVHATSLPGEDGDGPLILLVIAGAGTRP